MNRKIFAPILSCVMLLCGCSSGGNGSSQPKQSSAAQPASSTAEESAQTEPTLPEMNGRARSLAGEVMGRIDYADMMEIDRADYAQALLGLDLYMCEDFYGAVSMLSANLHELVIAKPRAGCENDVREALKAHFDHAIDDAAFYPEQQQSAAGSQMGETSDGYIWIIIHENGSEGALALSGCR